MTTESDRKALVGMRGMIMFGAMLAFATLLAGFEILTGEQWVTSMQWTIAAVAGRGSFEWIGRGVAAGMAAKQQ